MLKVINNRAINNRAIRDKSVDVFNKAQALHAKARIAACYKNLYYAAQANGASPDELRYRHALARDWGRQVGQRMLDLMRSMESLERLVEEKKRGKVKKIYDRKLKNRIYDIADPDGEDRRKYGNPVLTGREVIDNWRIVKRLLHTAARLVATRLREAEVINDNKQLALFRDMWNAWKV